MSKKLLFIALSLTATVFLAASSFGQACSSGIDVHYVGGGSSAQFNTLSFGAVSALQALAGYTSPTNVWESKVAQLEDDRSKDVGQTANPQVDTGLTVWIVYDSAATCNLYIGFKADSAQGDRYFFSYKKAGTGQVGVIAEVYGNNSNNWVTAACSSQVPGNGCLNNLAGGLLPASIQTFLTTKPSITGTGTAQKLPPAYCGQLGNTAGKPESTTAYCFFNAAHTDIRTEDALYATQRALSSYNTTNSLTGLGYNNTNCGAVNQHIGCATVDSFNQGVSFYTLNFAIKGTDPITTASVPPYTTLPLGASPLVVFVNNADSTNSLGFGVGQPTSYLHTDILSKKLANVFEGEAACTGDILPTVSSAGNGGLGSYQPAYGGLIPGGGQPIQAVLREPLSGTYNAFEFTAVRTFKGSGLTLNTGAGVMVGFNKITTSTSVGTGPTWFADQESGQEMEFRDELPTGPATGWTAGTNSTHCAPFPDGTIPCGDPLYLPTGTVAGSTSGTCPANNNNPAIKVRAVGTGLSVKTVLGVVASPEPSTWNVVDGIGYAFWGYSNFQPACVGAAGSGTTGNVTCSQYLGHYLTVDGLDPVYTTAGGAGFGGNVENTNGANNFPQCGLINKVSGFTFPCVQLPFTNLYNGKYPLWSMLRLVTFENVPAASTTNGQETPEGVINVVGYAQTAAAPGGNQLSDFAPFLHDITGLPYTQGGTPPTGDLNLGVFRSHYLQGGVPPDNGHQGCGSPKLNPLDYGDDSFVGVFFQGGTKTSPTCLVDAGGDMGGEVLTVQDDVDFILDFDALSGTAYKPNTTVDGVHFPGAVYNLHR